MLIFCRSPCNGRYANKRLEFDFVVHFEIFVRSYIYLSIESWRFLKRLLIDASQCHKKWGVATATLPSKIRKVTKDENKYKSIRQTRNASTLGRWSVTQITD